MSKPSATNTPRRYLRSLHIDAYGGMSQRDVGPFASGMNVVFGENEAGKTTTASFVGGVLFGWEEARGRRNVYRPANAQRSGTLVFADRDESTEALRLSRARNADGLVCSMDEDVLADIDKNTFKTVFSLDSDELRKLGKTNDVTARLLTAGSGTAVSPAHALETVDRRLAACLSRSANYPDSIPNCRDELAQVRTDLSAARREADRLRSEDREFKDLEPRMHELEEALTESNARVETIVAQRDAVAKLDADMAQLRERESNLDDEESELETLLAAHWDNRDERVPQLDSVEEQAIRESIDDLAEERNRLDSVVSLAKREYASSQALYDALCEADDVKEQQRAQQRQRTAQLGLTVITPILLALVGVPAFVHGRMVNSLSFTAVGAMLMVFAVCIALVGIVFMLLRPAEVQAEIQKRIKDAQWVMLQDKKKLEAMEGERQELDAEITRYLDSAGLQAASGSLRRARALLDAAHRSSVDWMVLDQRRQSLTAQRVVLEDQMNRNASDRAAAMESLGLDACATTDAIVQKLQVSQNQRDAQLQTNASYHARYGELRQELSAASLMRDFDDLKLREQTIRTRLDDSTEEFARLLLTRRILVNAIAAWESKSQPRVYQQASRLLAMMTGGKWEQVLIDAEGNLQVVDQFDMARDPTLLSMGTCQQLYLALRIALLMEAENVGRSIPVLADDILVNFDHQRRKGAAKALAELSRQRQVIVFTCHEEIVRLMQETTPNVNVITL